MSKHALGSTAQPKKISRRELVLRAPGLARNFLTSLQTIRKKHGDSISTHLPYPAVWMFHPEAVKNVLVDHPSKFRKSANYRLLRELLGESVITSDGDKWRKQRRSVAPLFHGAAMRSFLPSTRKITKSILEKASLEPEVYLHSLLCEWSLNIASTCFFDSPFPMGADQVSRLFDRGARALFLKTVFRIQGPLADLVPWTREYKYSLNLIDQWVRDLIEKRKQEIRDDANASDKIDILRKLLAESDAQELRDQCVSILLAGHDTTALTLFWTLQLLFAHPEVLEKVKLEVNAVMKDRSEIDEAAMSDAKYLEQILSESMRLYPVVNTLSREALEDVEVSGMKITKGTLVQFAPFVTHRHPDFWDEPNEFRPERFSKEALVKIPEGAYFPFGLGARECVGQGFAMQQMKLFLMHLFMHYEIKTKDASLPKTKPFLTLRPDHDKSYQIRKK